MCNFKSEFTLAQIGISIAKPSKRRVLLWIIGFVKIRVGTCTKRISYCKTLKKSCFEMEYRICEISNQRSHLHKSDFSFQNAQKDVFCEGLSHLCKLKSEWALAQSGLPIVKRSKRRVLRISHLCNIKSEFTLAQIRFSISKHSKRRALLWIFAFVQIKVRVSTYTKRISHRKTLKKTYFGMEYRICAISSRSSHLHLLDFLSKTLKKTCFAMVYRICANDSQSRYLHKAVFPS